MSRTLRKQIMEMGFTYERGTIRNCLNCGRGHVSRVTDLASTEPNPLTLLLIP